MAYPYYYQSMPVEQHPVVLLPPGIAPPLVVNPEGGPPIGLLGVNGNPWLPPAHPGLFPHEMVPYQAQSPFSTAVPYLAPETSQGSFFNHPNLSVVKPDLKEVTMHAEPKGDDRTNLEAKSSHVDLFLQRQLHEQDRQNRQLMKTQNRIEEERRRRLLFEQEQATWRQREIEQHQRNMACEFLAKEAEKEYRIKLRSLEHDPPPPPPPPPMMPVHTTQYHTRNPSNVSKRRTVTVDSADGDDGDVHVRIRKPCRGCHNQFVVSTRQIAHPPAVGASSEQFGLILKDADIEISSYADIYCESCKNKMMRREIYYQEKAKRERHARKVEDAVQNVIKKREEEVLRGERKFVIMSARIDDTPTSNVAKAVNENSKEVVSGPKPSSPSRSAVASIPMPLLPQIGQPRIESLPISFLHTPQGTQISFHLPNLMLDGFQGQKEGTKSAPQHVCAATINKTRTTPIEILHKSEPATSDNILNVKIMAPPGSSDVIQDNDQQHFDVRHLHQHFHHGAPQHAKETSSKGIAHQDNKSVKKDHSRFKDVYGYFPPADQENMSSIEVEQLPVRSRVGHAYQTKTRQARPVKMPFRKPWDCDDSYEQLSHRGRSRRRKNSSSTSRSISPTYRLSYTTSKQRKVLSASRGSSSDTDSLDAAALNRLLKKQLNIGAKCGKRRDKMAFGRIDPVEGFVTVPIQFPDRNVSASTNIAEFSNGTLSGKLQEARTNASRNEGNGGTLVIPAMMVDNADGAASAVSTHPNERKASLATRDKPAENPHVPGAFPGQPFSEIAPGMVTPLSNRRHVSSVAAPGCLDTPREDEESAGAKQRRRYSFGFENSRGNGYAFFKRSAGDRDATEVEKKGVSFWDKK